MLIQRGCTPGFSPPKGIHCFSTLDGLAALVEDWAIRFQSPEGDSLFFYPGGHNPGRTGSRWVSVPRRGFIVFLRFRGDHGRSYVGDHGRVSVPRRGFIVFLRVDHYRRR